MSNFTAVYDACVLYPASLRDFLMELALTDLFRARWSEKIHQEWIRNVLKNRLDLNEGQLLKTKAYMDANVRDALVIEIAITSDASIAIANLDKGIKF
jgi:hypothetical protein